MEQYTCLRCQHTWYPRTPALPKWCPKCNSPYWNKPKGNHDVNKLNPVKTKRRFHCFRCDHNWDSLLEHPTQCPACHSGYWDKQRQDTKEVKG